MSAFTVHTSIEGNLTADPIVRNTSNGLKVANFRVAVTSRTRANNGELRESTQFIPVVCWRNFADAAEAYLTKGQRVMVSGDMKQRQYTNTEGNTVYITELHADALGLALRWAVKADADAPEAELEPVA